MFNSSKKKDSNIILQKVSNDTEEIKKFGGQDNIEKITRKLDNEWDKKPSHEYINNFKNIVIKDYEKYEKKLKLTQENKPEEE